MLYGGLTNGKLVRDRIPDIIKNEGGNPNVRVLSDQEYKVAVLRKLEEESAEVVRAAGDRQKLIKEFADLRETYLAALAAHAISESEVEDARHHKGETKGRFLKRFFLVGAGR